MICSFGPIVDRDSRILILGSIPGKESLRKGQYYGHERNSFWRVIYTLFQQDYQHDYDERTRFLQDNHIALWDVIRKCERKGSLDANIRNPLVNDFHQFFFDHPNIKHVFFNGRTAYHMFKRHIGFDFDHITFMYLGSTSPAHAIEFENRLKDWSKIRAALE